MWRKKGSHGLKYGACPVMAWASTAADGTSSLISPEDLMMAADIVCLHDAFILQCMHWMLKGNMESCPTRCNGFRYGSWFSWFQPLRDRYVLTTHSYTFITQISKYRIHSNCLNGSQFGWQNKTLYWERKDFWASIFYKRGKKKNSRIPHEHKPFGTHPVTIQMYNDSNWWK